MLCKDLFKFVYQRKDISQIIEISVSCGLLGRNAGRCKHGLGSLIIHQHHTFFTLKKELYFSYYHYNKRAQSKKKKNTTEQSKGT